jgi:hypothetical protein
MEIFRERREREKTPESERKNENEKGKPQLSAQSTYKPSAGKANLTQQPYFVESSALAFVQ